MIRMKKRKKPGPKLYLIETFKLSPFSNTKGWLSRYRAAGSNRAQAVKECGLASNERILSIVCIGTSTVTREAWSKTP